MEKVKKTVAIILLITCVCSVSVARSYKIDGLTEYQNKRLALVDSAMNSITNGMTQSELTSFAYVYTDWLEKHVDAYKLNEHDPLGELELMEGYLEETCGIVPWVIGSKGNTMLEEYQYRKYNAICRRYQEGRKSLDENSTDEVLAEEIQIQRQRAIIKTRLIERVVRGEFTAWNKKGEYEKTAAYEKRLQERSEWAFDSICQDAITNCWRAFLHYEFLNYDADNEILPLELYYEDKTGNKLMSVMYNITVSPDWVRECKNAISERNGGYIVSMGEYNGYLFPMKLILTPYDYQRRNDITGNDGYGYCPCVVVTEGVKPLVIKFDDLKIDNKYLAGKEVVASFEKFYTWRDELSDSIKALNFQLKQHPCFYINNNSGYFVSNGKWGGNTQMNNNVISIYEYQGKRHEFNMTNPSKDAYDNFMRDIHFFYEECMDNFNLIQETKKLFPNADRGYKNRGEIISCIRNNYFAFTWRSQSKLSSDQITSIRKLSNAECLSLRKLFIEICQQMIITQESLRNEYTKNQQYFTSPEDFVRAYYVSDNYKAELKARKKQVK